MQPLRILLAIVLGIGALLAVIWSFRDAPWVERQQPPEDRIARRLHAAKEVAQLNAGVVPEKTELKAGAGQQIEAPPPPAKAPPFPQVDSGRTVFEFGSMLVQQEGHHTFRIENKGEGTLLLAKGPAECTCVVSRLSSREVPPGGFADVELRWTPREPDSEFSKAVIFWTNDPKRPNVRYSVAGRVAPLAVIMPGKWHAGTVTDEHDGKAIGTIASEVTEKFGIVSVKPNDPNVKVDYRPLTKAELMRAKNQSGYEFTVTVGKGIRLGPWRSMLKIVTTLEGKKSLDVELTAYRSGPIRFLSAIPIVGRAHWDSSKLQLNLDRFSCATGSKAALPAIVDAMKEDFQLRGVKSSYPFVKVSLQRDATIAVGGRQGVRFVFEVPPGAPAVTHLPKNPLHVTVATNHPAMPQIDFELAFVAS